MHRPIGGAPLPLRRNEAEIRKRIRVELVNIANRIRQEAMAEWARDDDAPFPSHRQIEEQATAELQVLLNGLGPWAAIEADLLGFRRGSWFDDFLA